VEERRGGFKAAILREGGFPVSKRCLSVWILFVNNEPMGAYREREYGCGLLLEDMRVLSVSGMRGVVISTGGVRDDRAA